VRVFETGRPAGRLNSGVSRKAVGADDAGIYRLRGAADATWSGQAYRRRETIWHKTWQSLALASQLLLPVALLLSALASVYLYLDADVPGFVGTERAWMTRGHLLVPAAFFVIALTNRRYGAGVAFAQVTAALAIAFGVAVFAPDAFQSAISASARPTPRVVGAFGLAFFAASMMSIVVFDATRGPRWWTAPFVSAVASALVFAAIFCPAAYAGVSANWLQQMFVYGGVLAAVGIVLLIPYWLLRPIVPPLSGFGGY
jgi:uncharacterized PurR-regulated membrane protein YhhQ (DUF165 family)